MLEQHKTTLAVLAVLAALSFFVPAERTQAISQPGAQAPIEAPKIEAPLNLVAALPTRVELPEFPGDPFSGASLKARPAARRVAAAPAGTVPAVPANPYRFAGEVRQPGATHRFLVRGSDILEVKPGEVLDDGYRVEAVDGMQVVLVHLASGHRHAVALSVPAAASATPAAATALPGTTPGAPALLIGGSAGGIPPKALRKG